MTNKLKKFGKDHPMRNLISPKLYNVTRLQVTTLDKTVTEATIFTYVNNQVCQMLPAQTIDWFNYTKNFYPNIELLLLLNAHKKHVR